MISPQFRCQDREVPGIGRVTTVEGTPADCVRAAVALPGEPKPDWVVSGVNHGSNLGIDIYYSGTVAAAREAAILGIPSVAISVLVKADIPADWTRITSVAAAILPALIAPQAPSPAPGLHEEIARHVRSVPASPGFWNVNLPCPIRDGDLPVEMAPLSTDPFHIQYESSRDEYGRCCLTSKGNYHDRPAAAGTDVAAVFAGRIALTRISL